MFDILSNHLVKRIKLYAEQTPASVVEIALPGDLWGDRVRPQRALFIVDVGVVDSGASLILTFQDSADNSTFDTDFATAAAITATGTYLIDLPDFQRYLKISSETKVDGVTFGIMMITFEERWRAVTQTATALALTYGTGRKGRVASS